MLIKDFVLRDETVLEVGKFAILWNCFERSWCNCDCNSPTIKSIAKTIPIDVEKRDCLAKVLNERRHLFQQLTTDYVEISLHPPQARLSRTEDREVMRQFIEQTGDDQTRGCLLVLWRIRNNLMHGVKLIEELDGQYKLFCTATAVLESIGE